MSSVYLLLSTLAQMGIDGESDTSAVLRLINAFLSEQALESSWASEQKNSIVSSWLLTTSEQIEILLHFRVSVSLYVAEMRAQGVS